jgi:hypothetical protein
MIYGLEKFWSCYSKEIEKLLSQKKNCDQVVQEIICVLNDEVFVNDTNNIICSNSSYSKGLR